MDKLHAFIKQKLENHVTDNNSKFPLDLLDVYLNLSDSERKDSALSGLCVTAAGFRFKYTRNKKGNQLSNQLQGQPFSI